MLKDFEKAVRQFQQALAGAGITGDVEMTIPREPMLKMHHEWLSEPVFRSGPLPVDFERSVFEFIAPGGWWTIRHAKKPTPEEKPPAMPSDPALYALVMENNRMLKALTERLTPSPAPSPRVHSPGCIQSDVDHPEGCYVMTGAYNAASPKTDSARWTLAGRLNDVSVPGETSPEQTLERLIRDAGAKTRWGEQSKPVTESDMQHVLKTGSLPELDLKLGGAAQALVDKTLSNLRDAALEGAEKAILHAHREDRRDIYPNRDEYEANFCGWTAGANAALDAVRALKSKPAPDGKHYGNFVHAVGKHRAEAMAADSEPIHDFGWALQQMRAGKKARRRIYSPGQWYAVEGGELYAFNGTSEPRRERDGFSAASILATDWEVVDA